jgi:uncharacterized protein DUF3237
MITLEYEFGYRASLKPPLPVGPGPYGTRLFFEVTEGTFEGKRLKGKILTGGGDWLLVGADGFGRLDVRAQFVTDDGAAIYLSYFGLLEMNAKIQAVVADTKLGSDFGDQYFRTNPRFETGDPRYAWLNQTLFLAEGHFLPGRTVEYKVYRVV